jgi:hypothetical protein
MGSKSELLRKLVAASQKRQVLECPVLYRSGALGEIRTWRATADEDGRYCFAVAL